MTPVGAQPQPSVYGLDGRRLILAPAVINRSQPFSRPTPEPEELSPARIAQHRHRSRQEFARFALSLFAAVPGTLDLQFAALPDEPGVVIVSGLAQPLRLVFDPATGLPVSLGEVTFEDYRDVAGIRVPFRHVEMRGRRRVVETVKKVRVNGIIAPKMFGR